MNRKQRRTQEAARKKRGTDCSVAAVSVTAPEMIEAFNLACVCHLQGKLSEAERLYRAIIQRAPTHASAWCNLGGVLKSTSRLPEAEQALRESLRILPAYAEAWNNLGVVQLARHDYNAAVESFQHAVALKQGYEDALNNLCLAAREMGDLDALKQCNRLLTANPATTQNMLYRLRNLATMPDIMDDNAAIDEWRAQFESSIRAIAPFELTPYAPMLGSSLAEPPLSLHYQGRDNRALKELYASRFVLPDTPLPSGQHAKIRVGLMVSPQHEWGFLWYLRGIFQAWNSTEVELVVLAEAESMASIRKNPLSPQVRLYELTGNFEQMVAQARASACDVIWYWEAGTDSRNYFFPLFRLAPVQCTSIGMQETTAIPAMDHFLSVRGFEPEGAQVRYTERLHELQHMPVWLNAPQIPPALRSRADFGFSDTERLYVFPQNPIKIHPDFDALLAGILQEDKQGKVVLVDAEPKHYAPSLKKRFAHTIPQGGDRIVFLPRQDLTGYFSLLHLADVLLDAPHFGAITTSLQAMGCGRPVVSLRGPGLTTRTAAWNYRRMGMEAIAPVADSAQDYIAHALHIATNAATRAMLREAIVAGQSALFSNDGVLEEMERCFLQMATGKL